MRIVFMGTPDFSVPVLDALVEAPLPAENRLPDSMLAS